MTRLSLIQGYTEHETRRLWRCYIFFSGGHEPDENRGSPAICSLQIGTIHRVELISIRGREAHALALQSCRFVTSARAVEVTGGNFLANLLDFPPICSAKSLFQTRPNMFKVFEKECQLSISSFVELSGHLL